MSDNDCRLKCIINQQTSLQDKIQVRLRQQRDMIGADSRFNLPRSKLHPN